MEDGRNVHKPNGSIIVTNQLKLIILSPTSQSQFIFPYLAQGLYSVYHMETQFHIIKA